MSYPRANKRNDRARFAAHTATRETSSQSTLSHTLTLKLGSSIRSANFIVQLARRRVHRFQFTRRAELELAAKKPKNTVRLAVTLEITFTLPRIISNEFQRFNHNLCPLNEPASRVTRREISLSEVRSSITRREAYRASLSVHGRSRLSEKFGLLAELQK